MRGYRIESLLTESSLRGSSGSLCVLGVWDGFSSFEHPQDPEYAQGSEEVFDGVSTDDASEGIDLWIEHLTYFGEDVPSDGDKEVMGVGIGVWKEEDDEWECEQGIELYQQVGAQIPLSLGFAPIPIQDAGDTQEEKRDEEFFSYIRVDQLHDDDGEEGHEGESHGKAVPEQGVVVGCIVIIGGAQTGESDSEEENPISAPFPGALYGSICVGAFR